MADGRKIPYIIEMGINDEKLKRQMSQWDWEEIIGIKGFGKHFEKPAKEASDAIENAFANTSIDWEKALQTDAFKSAVTKIVQHANKELREGLLGKDEAKQVTEFISEIGKAWKEVGVAMDATGFARSMAAFAKSVEPLVGQVDKLTAAFGIFSDKINSDTAKVAGGFTVIGDAAGRAAVKVNKSIETMEAKLASIDDMLSEDYGKKFKFDTNLEDQFYDIDEAIEKVETNIEQLSKKFNSMSSSDKGFEETRRNLVQLYTEQIELYRKLELVDEEYTKKHSKDDSLLTLNAIDPKAVIGDVRATIETIVGDAKRQLKDISTSTKTTKDGINIPIKLPSQVELVKTINKYVKSINDSDAIHGVRLKLDSGWLNDAANVIEDKTTRAYGDTPADFDKNTTDLVKKTEERFSKIAKVIGDKQQGILDATDDWRKKMINAMSINAKDLEFQFGLESNMENTADALFNKLQEYFERPEYALDIKFNTEKIARDLKASIEAEGIELGVGGGTANIDANSLASALASVLFGKTSVSSSTKVSSANSNSTQKEVANETDEATDSGKEYIKVLDETTIHIDKVIESLRVFAKEANKANASNGSKHVASRLTKMGVDIGAIKNGASDTDIIKMLQTALMSKDEMGKAQGASLVGKLQSMMQTYKMDPEKGSGKVVDVLAKDIMELFNINELETELEEELIRRFEQLEIWEGVKKPGKALAALGNVRSTKKKIRTPAMEQIDEAIKYFEAAEEDTAPLQKLKDARQKFEDNGETDEAKKEFEKAALVFYDETKTVFNRLKDRWGDFKGVVQAEGRRPVNIDPKGAYPTRILEIPDDAVIAKVDIFEVFKTIRDIGFTGSSARRESSERKAEFEQKRVTYDPNTPNYIVKKPTPKKDIRYEDIEYDTFKTRESGRLPQEVALDATIESLEKRAAEIPELVERIEESKKSIAELEAIKQQIEDEISNLRGQDLPEFQMNAFDRYSNQKNTLGGVLKNTDSALKTNGLLDVGDISKLDDAQQTLVGRLKTITANIHNDSKASQEFADKIAEIVEAKKLSKEELEIARSKAAEQRDSSRVSLYTDLLFNRKSVDDRLESYQSQKDVLDENVGKNKNYAQKLIKELEASQGQSADKATKEAEVLAAQLIEVKERLYAEAKTYAKVLSDPNVDEDARQTALGKLQQTLSGLNSVTGKFANIQPYVPQTSLYNNAEQNNVDKWNKKYTNSEVRKLEKELKGLEAQLKEEEDEAKIAELKKQITNTKRNLTKLKKIVPDNVVGKKKTELGNIERQLREEQSQFVANENRKNAADKASSDLQSIKQDAAFLTKYNELLEKEKLLLEEVNKLKREGADKSVIDGKTEELKQATKALDDFLKKEKTMERTAYARQQAVEYQAQLHTAYRKRSVFDNQIGDINEDEENLSKYHLSGRVGSRALRRTEREVASEFINSGYMQHFSDMFGAKKQLEEAQSAYETAMNNFYEATDKQWDESLPEEQRVEWEKASTKALEDAERAKLQSDQIRNTILKTSKDEDFFRKLNTLVDNQNDRLALHMPTEDINNPKKVREFLTSDKGRWIAEQYQSEEKVLWDEYYEHLRQQQQNAISEFKQSWSVENGVLKATFKKSNVLGGWDDDLKSYDVEKNEQKRIEKLKKDIEAEREPIDGIIKDLQTQKKAAMRYGVVSDDDLKNDKLLQQNEQYNKNILKLTDDRIKLERELESIKADDSLDEKKQEKEIKRKQKEIDAINQEIQRNQALIDNRVKLMELHKQEKEESKQTPEEKALLATEKLVGMKQSLAQAEERVAARKADYESAKGTENEIKMLEALDNQIKKRDQIQEQITDTEKKIERLGQVTQKTEDAQDEVASTVDGVSSGKTTGGLLGIIKEAVGEVGVGNVDLTKIEEILSKILAILSGNGAAGSTRNSEMDAKLARIKELEAKQQLANEQKKTAETVKQVENAKKETTESTNVAETKAHKNVSKTQVYKDVQKSVDAFRTSELTADKEPLNAIKLALDELSKINDQNSQEYVEWQRKLGSALAAYGKKNGIENGRGYYDKVYAELEKNGITVDPKLPITNKSGISSALVEKGLVAIKEKEAKAKQSEAKAEEKITEEKKEQEKIRFTRKEKKELNRLKSEVKDYNPDDTTGTGSEFGGFATEKTLAAILEVLNKISTSGVPKNGGKSGGADDKDSSKDDELDRLAKKSGVSDVRGAIKQHGTLEARGVLKDISSEKIQKYNAAYNELIDKHKEFDAAGTLYDPNNQKTLGNMAIKVKDLGKQLEKSVAEAEQLEQLVNSSGTYQGLSLGSKEIVGNIDDVTFEELAKKRLQELGAEHVKFDKIHKRAIGTKRLDNKTVADLEVKYNDLSKAMYTYQKAERESLTGVPAFINGFKKKFNSIMQYLSMTMSIHQVLAQLRKGVQYVREIDLALTELKKVTDETEETYDKFLETAAKTGARLGTTISAVTEATATFAKLGYSMEHATEMAESAIVYKNVGDNIASTEDAADSIISTMKGFKLEASEAMRIVDSFNEVGNRFAITSRGIGEALRLSASALSEGGNSLDESIGLITAANEVVNDPSSVGTALKTLTLRLRGSKTELEEMGEDVADMATTTSQLQAKLLALTGGQVDIMLDENTFKNSTQILREMADAWEDMTDIQRASALELMGGRLLPLCIEICA